MTEFERLPENLDYLQFVASDPDLVAFYEIKTLGFVATTPERISPAREDALEDYDHEQLLHELVRDYNLDRADALLAETICLNGIYERHTGGSHGR